MKTYTCEICNQGGFTSPQQKGAHKRIKHPELSVRKKKVGRPRKNLLAATIVSATEANSPTIDGVKYCPDCGHFLFPYHAALVAMKGRKQ